MHVYGGYFLSLAVVQGTVSGHMLLPPLQWWLAKVNCFLLQTDLLGYLVTMTEVINTETFFLHAIFQLKLYRSFSMKYAGHILYLNANISHQFENKNTSPYSCISISIALKHRPLRVASFKVKGRKYNTEIPLIYQRANCKSLTAYFLGHLTGN